MGATWDTTRNGREFAALALLALALGGALGTCSSPERVSESAEAGTPDSGPVVAETVVESSQPAHATARDPKWAQPLEMFGVPNLHRVTPKLYRSAQPEEQGWASLEKLGIRTVLSLRAFHPDSIPKHSGLIAKRISFKSWHPEEEDVVSFLRIAHDPANQPLLVHCQHGADRTGMLIAIERMVSEGWSREDAIREMVEGGYGFHAIWQNMIDYVEHVDVERLRRLADIEPPILVR